MTAFIIYFYPFFHFLPKNPCLFPPEALNLSTQYTKQTSHRSHSALFLKDSLTNFVGPVAQSV